MIVRLKVKPMLNGVWCMVPDRCWCSRVIPRIFALVIVLSGLLMLFARLTSLAGQNEKTTLHLPLVAAASLSSQAVDLRAQIFRLIPDDSASRASQHFNQAQRALAAARLAQAQNEIEQVLSFAELQCAKEPKAGNYSAHLASLREYYEWYIELLMQRQRCQPHASFAARAWQASERLHWWLANTPSATPAPMPTLSLAQLQQQLLNEQSLLLAYALGTERSYLWAITKHEFSWFELPDRQTIEAKAMRLYQWLSRQPEPATNGLADEAAGLAQELSALLLQPAAAQLRRRQLLVVADGALRQLPFGVLPQPQAEVLFSTSQKMSGKLPELVGVSATRTTRRHRQAPTACRTTSALFSSFQGSALAVGRPPLIFKHEIINWPSATTVWLMRRRRQSGPDVLWRAQEPTVAVIADPVFGKYDERLLARLGADAAPAERPGAAAPLLNDVLAGLRNWDFMKALKLTRAEQQILLARLPLARSEAEAIAGVAPRSVQWLDFAANHKAAMHGLLANYPVIHFATHGFFNRREPALSGLVLSRVNEQGDPINGLLLNHEISALKLNAELIVVSACESALTESGGAGAYNSLAHSFLQAGARRVVASLWKVNDAATAELMKRFYRRMFNGGQNGTLSSPAAALRAAQLEMWRESRWQRPFYWAAFVLQGEE